MSDTVDRIVGGVLVLIALTVFSYYSIWVLVTPFLPDGHFINALFLPRIYAVLIPAAAAVLMLGFVLIFFAAVLMGQKTGKAKSS
ncbi:unnamed protein product [Closterium sp. Naga37s-1]|nr:unnamed protein product [Closterium sp. Naga37s-1]CAI5519458.1 unnamed protein product [Closterium sp. Naga37s-1]